MMRIIGVIAVWTVWAGSTTEANAQETWPREPSISVVGEGVARAAPDVATVRFGVVTVDRDPEEARRKNAEASRLAMNAAREIIQDERNIRLENLRLQPDREYDPETRRYIDRGFEAARDVVVRLTDLEQLPALITRIVQQGANRLHTVSYELDDPDLVKNEALQEAVMKAREKASLMASTLGNTAGRVLRVMERAASPIYPMRDMQEAYMAARSDAEPEPEAYAAGEIEVRATVEVVFALE